MYSVHGWLVGETHVYVSAYAGAAAAADVSSAYVRAPAQPLLAPLATNPSDTLPGFRLDAEN